MTSQRKIPAIDKDIDAVQRELHRRVGRRPSDALEYQAAWDANPDLRQRETDLFRERGFAQQERDQKAYEAAMHSARAQRAPRAKKCPTCGRAGFVATR